MSITLMLLTAFALRSPAGDSPDGERLRFARDVRPILSEYCFACHGPDARKREAELRLDTRAGLLGEGGAAGVVVPGDLTKSELWQRVDAADAMERMPPEVAQKELPPAARDTLRRWIEQGAPWEGHWAYEPMTRPEVPSGAAHPIDAFLRVELPAHGLAPQPPADRRTLLRRLSLDLIGLPPTAAELDAFLADGAADAYERQVERLLASPHYGERMAIGWLDLVRYADSVGYHGDQEMSVSPFRDYVIDAFNENLPFDRFTIEQLAGDLLPEPTLRQQVASGYNRLGRMSAEGGVQPKEYLAKYIAERVRNLGGTWLGSTLGCCECHDHKYDPFKTRDFYSFEAFFADLEEQGLYSGAENSGAWGPRIAVPTVEQRETLKRLDAAIADARRQLETETPALAVERAAWEAAQVAWLPLQPITATSDGGATLTVLPDGSLLASGASPDTDTYRLAFDALPDGITALRLEVLPDDSLPNRGPGRAGNGNFVLSELVARSVAAAAATAVTFASAQASFEQTGAAGDNPYGKWAVAGAIDGDAKGPTWGWAVMEQAGRANTAVFTTTAPIAGSAATRLELELHQQLGAGSHTLGRLRLSCTTAPPPFAADALPPDVAAALARPIAERSEAQRAQIAAHHRSIAPSLAPLRAQIEALTQQHAAQDSTITRTLVARSVAPREVRVLARGNWMDESGEVREPAFPSFLPSLDAPTGRRLTRLDLARWLVDPDHPLTARVFVNRLWKQFFGAGLSRRVDDLGSQGEWPSHPELLDWLARHFVDSHFDVKGVVRLLVTSAAYRQSSSASSADETADPDNRWLARQGRFRVDAELVRDIALQASGLLVERIGGRSVRPYQPAGYWAYLNFPTREWQADTGEALYRRGIYVHWQRQYLHPSLIAFDAPSREECAADRSRSNTPVQALVLLNDPIYVEAARVLAERMVREGGPSAAERIADGFVRTVARPPRPDEVAVLERLLESQTAAYRADPEAARALIAVGAAPVASDLDPIELAAWTAVARTLLNLHETITRD